MHSNERTIEYQDTSLRKYPFNKYYDYKDLNHVSKRVFQEDKPHSQTIDTHALRHKSKSKGRKSKHQQKRASKKSVNTTKTMSSSRLKYKPHNINMSITLDNYKEYNKQQIAEELHHYTKLCLHLRKENYSLKEELDSNKRSNRQQLIELQGKINKLNEKTLQMREKELILEQNKVKQSKQFKPKSKQKENTQTNNRPKTKEGQFKRFFLHFIDNFGRVDQKLQRKMLHQKSMQQKLIMGQRVLKQSSEFLKEKKYKFTCIFD